MNRDEKVLRSFFDCLQARDADGLWRCYDPGIEHTDWVFVNLRGRRVHAKWSLLFERVSALDVQVRVLRASANQGLAAWEITYPAAPPVRHRVISRFRFRGGRIERHEDVLDSDGRRSLGPQQQLQEHLRGPQPQLAVLAHRCLQKFLDESDEEETAPLPSVREDTRRAPLTPLGLSRGG